MKTLQIAHTCNEKDKTLLRKHKYIASWKKVDNCTSKSERYVTRLWIGAPWWNYSQISLRVCHLYPCRTYQLYLTVRSGVQGTFKEPGTIQSHLTSRVSVQLQRSQQALSTLFSLLEEVHRVNHLHRGMVVEQDKYFLQPLQYTLHSEKDLSAPMALYTCPSAWDSASIF